MDTPLGELWQWLTQAERIDEEIAEKLRQAGG